MPATPHLPARQRWLAAARLVSAAALGVVAQTAVDMPEGYFGAADQVSRVGIAYAAGLSLVTIVAAVLLVRGSPWGGRLAPLALAASVGLFVAAVVSDPVVAGLVILWNLVLLAGHLVPTARPLGRWQSRRGGAADDAVAEWTERHGPALRHLSLATVLLVVGVVGYRLSRHPVPLAVCVLLGAAALAFAAPLLLRLARGGSRAVWAVPVAAVLAIFAFPRTGLTLALLAVSHVVLLAILTGRQRATREILRSFYDRPSRLVVISFASVILVGTVLLSFPAAAGGAAVSPIDALFTATSATCVTGLIVLDTPTAFSTLGHGVILALIQVGGLGIMVLSTFAALLLGGRLGLRGERALTEMLESETAPTAYRLTRFIVLATLGVEALGAVGLAVAYGLGGAGVGQAVWNGVFHAVSAFCNAGFALHSDSLVVFREAPLTLLLIAGLIVVGGMGFAVLAGLGGRWWEAWRGGREGRPAPPRVLPTQVKVVLAVSAALLAAGTALFAVLEWHGALAGMTLTDKLVHALFQSATLRTAGFNSVELGSVAAPSLATATVVFMMVFMFIGASPGSTGGGIKTTTVAVLLAAIRSTAGRGHPARLFGREVSRDVVDRSLAILVISALVVTGGLFLLLLFEDQSFLALLFEVVSAFGTVGLSLGATAELGPVGKLIIIVLMFVGRIGPLTLALFLGTGGDAVPAVRYPQTRLMVG